MPQVKDPVCGMMIDSAGAAASSEHNGTRYYFCSTACQKAFDGDPMKYAHGSASK